MNIQIRHIVHHGFQVLHFPRFLGGQSTFQGIVRFKLCIDGVLLGIVTRGNAVVFHLELAMIAGQEHLPLPNHFVKFLFGRKIAFMHDFAGRNQQRQPYLHMRIGRNRLAQDAGEAAGYGPASLTHGISHKLIEHIGILRGRVFLIYGNVQQMHPDGLIRCDRKSHGQSAAACKGFRYRYGYALCRMLRVHALQQIPLPGGRLCAAAEKIVQQARSGGQSYGHCHKHQSNHQNQCSRYLFHRFFSFRSCKNPLRQPWIALHTGKRMLYRPLNSLLFFMKGHEHHFLPKQSAAFFLHGSTGCRQPAGKFPASRRPRRRSFPVASTAAQPPAA